MTTPNLEDWQTRTRIDSPVVFSAFEEVDGRMYANVRILRAGTSKNRRTYPAHVIKEAVDHKLFDGIRMFLNHDKKKPNPTERPLTEMVSAVESTSWDEANQAMNGRVEFFSREFYDFAQRAKDYLGVSINALVKGTRQLIAGQVHEDVSGWTLPRSVDWVAYPAAGGAILAFEDEDEEPMIDWTKITAEDLKKNNSAVFEAIQAEAKAEAEKEENEEEDPKKGKPVEQTMVTQESVQQMIADGIAAALKTKSEEDEEKASKRKTAGDLIRAAFEKSGLPVKTRARVMAGFESVEEFDEKAVTEAITAAKAELAELGVGPEITGMGPSGTGTGEGTGAPTKVFSVHESVKELMIGPKKEEDKEAAKEGTK